MSDIRFPLPAAFCDPAFVACLHECIDTPELVENFDRLYGGNISGKDGSLAVAIDKATGKRDADFKAFIAFVHDSVYLRLPADGIAALRSV